MRATRHRPGNFIVESIACVRRADCVYAYAVPLTAVLTTLDLLPSIFKAFSVVTRRISFALTPLINASFSATSGISRGSVHFARFFLNGCG